MSTLTILDRSYTFTPPTSLVDLLEDTSPAHTPIPFGCYAGHCAACMVTITQGHDLLSPPSPFEHYTLSHEELAQNIRLACQIKLVASGQITLHPTYS